MDLTEICTDFVKALEMAIVAKLITHEQAKAIFCEAANTKPSAQEQKQSPQPKKAKALAYVVFDLHARPELGEIMQTGFDMGKTVYIDLDSGEVSLRDITTGK